MWSKLRHEIRALGIEFDEHFTSRAGEATQIASRAFKDGTQRVIAVGGDGTLSEIVNGYFDQDGRPYNGAASVGLLPSGTGSDFRRSIGITNHSESIRAILNTAARPIDAASADFQALDGSRTRRFFINVASFGLGGDVSGLVNRWRSSLPRWIGGRLRFSAAAVVALGRYRNVRVSLRLDDQRELEVSSNLIIVANGRFAGGGMMLAPDARLDDGLLDVIVTDGITRWDVVKELPRIQRGWHLKHPKVSALRAREISIESEKPMAVDLDGEMAGFTSAHLSVLPSAIRFVG